MGGPRSIGVSQHAQYSTGIYIRKLFTSAYDEICQAFVSRLTSSSYGIALRADFPPSSYHFPRDTCRHCVLKRNYIQTLIKWRPGASVHTTRQSECVISNGTFLSSKRPIHALKSRASEKLMLRIEKFSQSHF